METVPPETAYLSLERILKKSKISHLWFCLYRSDWHTSDFTVPDLRLPRTLQTAVGIDNRLSAVLDTFPSLT